MYFGQICNFQKSRRGRTGRVRVFASRFILHKCNFHGGDHTRSSNSWTHPQTQPILGNAKRNRRDFGVARASNDCEIWEIEAKREKIPRAGVFSAETGISFFFLGGACVRWAFWAMCKSHTTKLGMFCSVHVLIPLSGACSFPPTSFVVSVTPQEKAFSHQTQDAKSLVLRLKTNSSVLKCKMRHLQHVWKRKHVCHWELSHQTCKTWHLDTAFCSVYK